MATATSDRAEYRRNIGPQALGRIFYTVGSAAVFVVATHVMEIDDVGHFSFALIFLTIVWNLSDLGTTAALGTLLGGSSPEERGEILGRFILFRLFLSVVVGIGAVGVALWTAPQEVRTALVLCCLLTPLAASRFFEPVFQVCQRPEMSVTLGIVYVLVLAATAIPGLVFFPDRPDLLVLSQTLSGVAYAIAGYVVISRLVSISFKVSMHAIWEMLGIVGPVGLSSLLTMLNLRAGALILSSVGGPSALATYYAAQRFLEVGGAIAATAITPVFSMAGRRAKQAGASSGTARAMFVALALSAPVAFLSLPLSEPVVSLLYGAELYSSAGLLPYMAVQFMIFCVALATMPDILTSHRPDILIWSSAAALVTNVSACYLLIPAMAETGAAIAALLSEMVMAGFSVLFLAMSRDRRVLLPALCAVASAVLIIGYFRYG